MASDVTRTLTGRLYTTYLRSLLSHTRYSQATVTESLSALQRAGLITCKRGTVKIANRLRLEEAACECYETMTRQVKKWHVETA